VVRSPGGPACGLSRPPQLTCCRAVEVLAATLVPGHAHPVLQQQGPRAPAGPPAPRGVTAVGVTMEVRTGARTRLPTRPFYLASSTVCTVGGLKRRVSWSIYIYVIYIYIYIFIDIYISYIYIYI